MTSIRRLLKTGLLPAVVAVASIASTAHAAAPGISGAAGTPVFNLNAQDAYLNQPDGAAVYSWGYGCKSGFTPTFVPMTLQPAGSTGCPTMQVPGPTLVVNEGDIVTINLTNSLPAPAGNTSILFPGFQVCVGNLTGASATSAGTCGGFLNNGVPGLLTQEAQTNKTVTYSFYAGSPGTHSYYSGTQSDLQIEMGLYGAIIVLPTNSAVLNECSGGGSSDNSKLRAGNVAVKAAHSEPDFRLSSAAYDTDKSCYDREYLFQFSEMDANIHAQAQAQVTACLATGCSLEVPTEPYRPSYYLINGRSMPDDMDGNYDLAYPHQPYNGDPHMHPGELTLLRIIGQGRWQHPFHEHANHVRILARDASLILSASNSEDLAGPALFTTTTTPGQTMDGIFYYTGRGLNWDMYGHHQGDTADPLGSLPCYPDVNGYYTALTPAPYTPDPSTLNYYEWCADHNKPLEANPVGDVGSGGPVTLPNPLIFTNGAWYGGSPYLGQDATSRATGPMTNLLPSDTPDNPSGEKGFAFMWHSHNEREITTNNVFPGGMMMMMLVDPRDFIIDETR